MKNAFPHLERTLRKNAIPLLTSFSGRAVVRILFGTAILKSKMYSTLTIDERYLAFLFQMTADCICTKRPMFVTILTHLCIIIENVNSVIQYSDFIKYSTVSTARMISLPKLLHGSMQRIPRLVPSGLPMSLIP